MRQDIIVGRSFINSPGERFTLSPVRVYWLGYMPLGNQPCTDCYTWLFPTTMAGPGSWPGYYLMGHEVKSIGTCNVSTASDPVANPAASSCDLSLLVFDHVENVPTFARIFVVI